MPLKARSISKPSAGAKCPSRRRRASGGLATALYCHCRRPKHALQKSSFRKSSKGPFLDNCATCGSTSVGMVRFENVRADKNLGLRSDGVAAGRFSQVVNLCHARLHMSAHACQRDGCLCAPNYYCECWRVRSLARSGCMQRASPVRWVKSVSFGCTFFCVPPPTSASCLSTV